MGPREIVDAYLEGRINSWGVFRRLVKAGLTTATALAVTGALPGAVKTFELGTLTGSAQSPQEQAVLDVLVSHLASQLDKVANGGPIRPLAVTLARIGANNRNLINCPNENCDPIPININTGDVNLNGVLNSSGNIIPEDAAAATGGNNLVFRLDGNISEVKINLAGTIDPPPNDPGVNVNLGQVNLNFDGNAGEVPLNFNDNLANLPKTPVR